MKSDKSLKTEINKIVLGATSLFISFNSFAQEKSGRIPEVVISGNRMGAVQQEVSQTISVIKKKEFQFLSAGNTGEALQNTGNITVQQSQNGGGSPIIRGFEANRLGVVVDGVRMNTAIFRGGHLHNILRVDNGQLERLEVFYGAGSTQFGSDALGGVLNFVTQRPLLHKGLKGSVFLRHATATNESSAGFSVNIGKEKFASLTSFTYSKFGNVMMGAQRDPRWGDWGQRIYVQARINNADQMILNENPNEQIHTEYNQYNILQKFLFQPNERTSHLINFQYSNSTDVNRYDRLTEKQNNRLIPADPITNRFISAEWYYGPEARLMAAYNLSHQIGSEWIDQIKWTLAYQNYKESRNNRNYGSLYFRSQRENVDVASINLDISKNKGIHQLSYGLELNNNWVGSSVVRYHILSGDRTYASTRYPDGGSRTENYAIYAQDIIALSKDFAYLNIGGRIAYNRIASKVNDTLRKYSSFQIANAAYSVNAGLSFLPTKSNRFTLNFSSGFRTPNLDDVSKVFENATWIQINDPNIKPELAMNYEISAENKLTNNFEINFGAYYTSVIDYISNQPTTFNGNSSEIINGVEYQYQRLGNANAARIYGGYGSFKMSINPLWQLDGNLNYTYGRLIASSSGIELPLDHIPPLSGRFALRHTNRKIKAELSMLFNSDKKSEDYNTGGEDNIDKSADPINGYTPAWYILNLRMMYEINKQFSFQAALENLFDTHYRIFASGISSSGRNLRLTARFEF